MIENMPLLHLMPSDCKGRHSRSRARNEQGWSGDPCSRQDHSHTLIFSGSLDGGCAFQAEFFSGLLAHLELHDFASDRHREGIDELNVTRYFVMSNLPFAVCYYLLFGGPLAGFELDPGHDLFTVFGIRYTDDLHIADLGMGIEELLDLSGIDVFAATNDHILDTTDDVDVALFIHSGKVTCMHPASSINGSGRCLGIIPVTEHDAITTRAKLTWLTKGDDVVASGINNFNLKVRVNDADGTHALLQG